MLKKTKLGFVSLALGVILTAIGSKNYLSASADVLSPNAVHNLAVAFYVGIGMIVLSIALFFWAGSTAGKD